MKNNEFNNKNYYEILNVNKNASKSEIKKAYFSLCQKYHPDKCKEDNANENFIKITKAYEILYNDESRSKYDEFLNSNNNDSEFNENEYNNFSQFDNSEINFYFENDFKEEDFVSFLSKYSEIEKIYFYQYYWITFWDGTYFSEKLLKTKNLTKILSIFAKEINLYNERKDLYTEESKFYNNFIDSIINNFKQNNEIKFNSYRVFNIMAKLINDDNFFDDKNVTFLALLNYKKTNELFVIFEKIYFENEKNKDIRPRRNPNEKISYKQKTIFGMSLGTVIFVILLVVFIVRRF